MSRIFAIGDVHGCNATLHKLVTEKIQPGKSDHLCFIGDYIDRGPDSKGVVDYILQLEGEGFNIHTLRGNHEQIMLDSVNSEDDFELWRVNGGVQTMRSYGISSFNEMSQDHQDFFQNTSHYFLTDNYILVHAGFNFKLVDPFLDMHSMLWIRDFDVDLKKTGGKPVIHGHTPIPLENLLKQDKSSAINIDGGCVYRDRPGHGYLVALNLTSGEWLTVKNCERPD